MKKTGFGVLEAGIKDAVRQEKGLEPKLKGWATHKVAAPARPEEVKAVRQKLHKSQAQLAEILGVSSSAVQSWEQGIRKPEAAVSKILRLLVKHPDISEMLLQV